MEGSAPPKKDGVCGVGDGLSTGVPSALSPEPQTPGCPHSTLFPSALLLLEPRVSGCEQIFVHWLSKGHLCLWQTPISPWQTKSLISTARYYVGTSPWLCSLGWGAQLGLEAPHFSGRTFAAEISLQNLSYPLSLCGFFCKSLLIRLLFRYPSVCYSG